jgi:hypothetical protein
MVTLRFSPHSRHRQQVVRQGKLKGHVALKFIGAVNRGSEEKGDSTLDRGSESDLINEDRRVGSNDVAALTISQCESYFCKDAVSQQNLVINYVERDPPIRTHIPKYPRP